MATGVSSWSQTAATNATADSNVNMAENIAASILNDGVRSAMASVAKYRDDQSGALLAGGTSSSGVITAYTVTSNQGFASLSALDGQELSVKFSLANGSSPTLAVDGLTAKPIQVDGTNALVAGGVSTKSVWEMTYDNSVGAFILKGGNSIGSIPAGFIGPYGGTSAPAGWLLCDGSAVSRTTYSALFAAIGTAYGTGNGSTTFNVPDMGGRVPAGKEATATRLTTAGSGVDGGTLGASGGSQTQTISQANLPNCSFTVTDPGHLHVAGITGGTQYQGSGGGGTPVVASLSNWNTSSTTTGISVASGGSNTGHANVQPTMILNYIIKT